MARASATYHEQLGKIVPGSDPSGVIGYFKTHAVTHEMAVKYKLGYVAEPLGGDERFVGRIAIPYLTPAGVVGMNYRAMNGDTPKYLKPHGQKARLYNADAYFYAGEMIGVAEGEIDAIVASECLGVPTLGVPGAQSYQKTWNHLLRDFNTVVIWADGDEAGEQFAQTIADAAGWRARIVTCRLGEDVASMVAAGGVDHLRQLATRSRDDRP